MEVDRTPLSEKRDTYKKNTRKKKKKKQVNTPLPAMKKEGLYCNKQPIESDNNNNKMLNFLVFQINYAISLLLHFIHNMLFSCNVLLYLVDGQISNHPSKYSSAIKTSIKIH